MKRLAVHSIYSSMYEYCFQWGKTAAVRLNTFFIKTFFKDYSKWERSARAMPLHHKAVILSNRGGVRLRPSPTGKSGKNLAKDECNTVVRQMSVFMHCFVNSALWTGKSQNAVQNDFTTLPKLSVRRTTEKVEEDQITSKRKGNIKTMMVCTVKQERRL